MDQILIDDPQILAELKNYFDQLDGFSAGVSAATEFMKRQVAQRAADKQKAVKAQEKPNES